ncbi:hypothetical protein ASE23_23180 [Rhizobium sp. Root73]|uniref:hypothetical protein n=1 Tax=unclassified Rhizobium TaxID=2613769 RepID=UPI00056AE521|nr:MULTISPECIES: hypothetical protein [unclassified Rhizobium]KQY16809.1 hypothetical protein ASD36_22585 [Rhizobium sp. Root1334]KRC11368.1 hypothetical protein ASE23_23180 [Rhizobium sp. Root73]
MLDIEIGLYWELKEDMTATDRQAFMQYLIERARASDSPIDGDADFMMLAQLWIDGEIDIAEVRERYGQVRERRLEERRTARFAAVLPPSGEALSSADDLLDEIGRMSHSAGY